MSDTNIMWNLLNPRIDEHALSVATIMTIVPFTLIPRAALPLLKGITSIATNGRMAPAYVEGHGVALGCSDGYGCS